MSGPGLISKEAPGECELCGELEELRPYGPNGERVCFRCGMKDEAAARRAFYRHVIGEAEDDAGEGVH